MTRTWPDQEPALLPLMPLVYVAWADLNLDDVEIARIREVADCRETLGDACGALASWLDPDDPPSAKELARLKELITARAPDQAPATLAELGARLDGAPAIDRDALRAVEEALAVDGDSAVQALLRGSLAPPPSTVPAPDFPVATLTTWLDGPHADVRQQVRGLLAEPTFRHQPGMDAAPYRQQVLAWIQRLADAGIGALAYPGVTSEVEDLGPFLAAMETLACFDLSLWTKVGVQFGLFGGSVYFLGTARHHQRVLPGAASMALPGCFAMTETGHGSNVRELQTVATWDPDGGDFVLQTPAPRARKDYIGNAALHGRMATVFSQLQVGEEAHGVHAFLVSIRTEDGSPATGVSIEDCGPKVGLDGVDNGRLHFDGVRVPREDLLDRFASVSADGVYSSPINSPSRRFFTMLGTLVGGRVSVANAALTATKVALTIAVRYGAGRRQFGPEGAPEQVLLDYPSHQLRLLPRLAQVYALDAALHELTEQYTAAAGNDGDKRQLEARAAGLKAISTWHATRAIQTCRECCGGVGYLSENRFGALKADTEVFTTFEGDNTVLMQLVAKGLLTGFQRQFADDRTWSMLRYAGERAQAALDRLNPVRGARTDEGHLRDPAFQDRILSHREDDLLASLVTRLKRRRDAGVESFEAFLECQLHALALARAAVDLSVFRALDRRVKAAPPELVPTLDLLRDVYALDRIHEDVGWFLERGYVGSAKARAIRTDLHQRLADLRPHALHLVDAFALPETAIGAPIAAR